MLAGLTPERLRSLYPDDELIDPFNGVTARRADLEAELEQVRSAGYASNDVPTTSDAVEFLSLAVPVRREGVTVVALSVAAPAPRASASWRALAVKELMRTAQALEGQLE